jgi:hypothetical protein
MFSKPAMANLLDDSTNDTPPVLARVRFASNLIPKGTQMSRARVRVCLQDGLKSNVNRLARKGFVKFGANIGPPSSIATRPNWI